MNKYLFIYRTQPNPERQASPEEMQQMLAQWKTWTTKFKDHVVDMGDGLKSDGKTLTADGVTDGPFVEAKELLAGFSIVQAESYEEALVVAKECPMTMVPNFRIEVRQMMGY